jgi:hypothetical protein
LGCLDPPQGRRARHRLYQRHRTAPASYRLLGADAAQHHRSARPDVDHRMGLSISSAAPAATASPTPSSSTSATRTATGSRSIVPTTRPSIRISSRSSGTSRTRSARPCGARPRRAPGSRTGSPFEGAEVVESRPEIPTDHRTVGDSHELERVRPNGGARISRMGNQISRRVCASVRSAPRFCQARSPPSCQRAAGDRVRRWTRSSRTFENAS